MRGALGVGVSSRQNTSDLDSAAWQSCIALGKKLGICLGGNALVRNLGGHVSIGAEIEVPWSSFFPDLWIRYRLNQLRIGDLSPAELDALSAECAALEATLLPRLHATVECGIPRGNDRYWEFAFRPVHDTSLLVRQIELLTMAGLIPRDKRHSLQVTLGGIEPCRSLYYLAMVLELFHVEPARVRDGLEKRRQVIHTGWARKGRAGIHRKGADELQAGAQVASELRILQLPNIAAELSQLMSTLQWGANAIADLRLGRDTLPAQKWREVELACAIALQSHGLPDGNWGGTVSNSVELHAVWFAFSEQMPAIRETLLDLCERGGLCEDSPLDGYWQNFTGQAHRFERQKATA